MSCAPRRGRTTIHGEHFRRSTAHLSLSYLCVFAAAIKRDIDTSWEPHRSSVGEHYSLTPLQQSARRCPCTRPPLLPPNRALSEPIRKTSPLDSGDRTRSTSTTDVYRQKDAEGTPLGQHTSSSRAWPLSHSRERSTVIQ